MYNYIYLVEVYACMCVCMLMYTREYSCVTIIYHGALLFNFSVSTLVIAFSTFNITSHAGDQYTCGIIEYLTS